VLQRYRDSEADERPALSVREAAHAYGRARALGGVSLDIGRGEIYCLLGPNGAGKTTLIKAICGRLELRGGKVRIDGRYSAKEAAARRLTGYVPQEIALHRQLTVSENLAFFGRMFGLGGRALKDATRAILERAGLEAEARRRVAALSGGYQRRVNIAAAALNKPALLVLDEPTVGIDVQAREDVHALLRGLRDDGAAILMTTHDLDQAQALADRIGILDQGVMRVEGAPDDLLREAFGDDRELVLELPDLPDLAMQDYLRELDFAPLQSPTSWATMVEPDHLDVAAFADELARAGVEVKEVRVRKPDLTSLFLKVLGEAAEP
jgi:ABC-2 type transport system ATP-binding protein